MGMGMDKGKGMEVESNIELRGNKRNGTNAATNDGEGAHLVESKNMGDRCSLKSDLFAAWGQ